MVIQETRIYEKFGTERRKSTYFDCLDDSGTQFLIHIEEVDSVVTLKEFLPPRLAASDITEKLARGWKRTDDEPPAGRVIDPLKD
jgi:hypothetical protein